MLVNYIYCPRCGFEECDIDVKYSRTTATSDWYLCPGCGSETSNVEIEEYND